MLRESAGNMTGLTWHQRGADMGEVRCMVVDTQCRSARRF